MIRVENIKRENNIITCTALIEDCQEELPLVFDVVKRDFKPFVFPKGYETCSMHIAYVRRFFDKSLEMEECLPEKKFFYWC